MPLGYVPWIPVCPFLTENFLMFSGTPIDYQDEPLTNDGFWPDLNLADFQEQLVAKIVFL